jgi:hypothetical protein
MRTIVRNILKNPGAATGVAPAPIVPAERIVHLIEKQRDKCSISSSNLPLHVVQFLHRILTKIE